MFYVLSYIFMLDSLLCTADSTSLGLQRIDGAETFTVFSPHGDNADIQSYHYSNGAVLATFGNQLYCMWQTSPRDEDSPETSVAYSISHDNGVTWSDPIMLAQATETHFFTSGGWWTTGDTLTAFINTWQTQTDSLQPSPITATQFISSTDGITWSEPQPVTMSDGTPLDGLIEQDSHQLSSGRIVTAVHFMPGMQVCPIYTDDPSATRGWQKGKFTPHQKGNQTRELEPSTYVQKDGTLVMMFRDQNSSFRKMASVSRDHGATWSTPTLTNIPDARTKQCAGNLPDGTAYLIGCPSGSKKRMPLVLMTSPDGICFDKAWLLLDGNSDLQPRRHEGKAKTLGYNYPKAIVTNGWLLVSYSVNKEDIQITRIPLSQLPPL